MAAIHNQYGKNFTTRSGDTLYDIPGYWNGDMAVAETLWDGGGTDTIDVSMSNLNDSIDLREGAGSTWGNVAIPNLYIAFGAQIENATTGSGNNTLIGNALGNVLIGNGGSDILSRLWRQRHANGGHRIGYLRLSDGRRSRRD